MVLLLKIYAFFQTFHNGFIIFGFKIGLVAICVKATKQKEHPKTMNIDPWTPINWSENPQLQA
jgi:hypothetical protein